MTTSKSLSGGRKKRGNGHKMNCGCPICKNMRKSKKRGGADDVVANEVADDIVAAEVADDIVAAEVADDVAEVEDDELWDVEGGRRRHKHKKSSRRTRRHKKSRKSRKSRRHRRH